LAKDAPPKIELFGQCPGGDRARLVYFDETGRHQEPYVQMFPVSVGSAGANVYHVTCPICGKEYATFDSALERVVEGSEDTS